MAEVSLKDQIQKLVDLQKIDSQIYDLNQELKDKPAMVDELKEAFESEKAHLNQLQDQLKQLEVKRNEYELDLKGKEDETAKAKTALNEIKNNKEYQAKITEIENIKADSSRIEEQILMSYDEVDRVNGEIEEEKKKVAEKEKVFTEKKNEVEVQVKEIEDRIKVLESQRQQLTTDIDSAFLDRYEKILKGKQGLAIVPVAGNTCGGCYMNVTPQMINQIKTGAEVVTCEYCSRILYIDE